MVKFRKSSFVLILVLLGSLAHAKDELVWMWPEDQERMLTYATMFEGAPYAYGARKPSSEDCSSFIQKIFTLVGIELPRSSREQASDPRFIDVPIDERQSGDLVFFKNTYRRGRKLQMVGKYPTVNSIAGPARTVRPYWRPRE